MKKILSLMLVGLIVSLSQGCTKKEAATEGASSEAPAGTEGSAPPPEQETKKDDAAAAPAPDAETKKE